MKISGDFGRKAKQLLLAQYPKIDPNDIPDEYKIVHIEYRNDDIGIYHPIFWHRLLKILYNRPSIVEMTAKELNPNLFFRSLKEPDQWSLAGIDQSVVSKIESGQIKVSPINWKYLLCLPSGGIIELGTADVHTKFYIARISERNDSGYEESDEIKHFIDTMLSEADRQHKQIFNPEREFSQNKDLKVYLLFNVYLSNYQSGEAVLSIVESLEASLSKDLLKYDATTLDKSDEDKYTYFNQSLLRVGTYFSAANIFFFMALEGFVNIIFHAFLKTQYREGNYKIERRFDLEQKLRFLHLFCNGFREGSVLPPEMLSEFIILKNYRNSIFHSKVEDTLNDLAFVEDGFVYSIDMENYQNTRFPRTKPNLEIEGEATFFL